jgi:hypothetical protein
MVKFLVTLKLDTEIPTSALKQAASAVIAGTTYNGTVVGKMEVEEEEITGTKVVQITGLSGPAEITFQ